MFYLKYSIVVIAPIGLTLLNIYIIWIPIVPIIENIINNLMFLNVCNKSDHNQVLTTFIKFLTKVETYLKYIS